MREWLVAADDRTGALETAAELAAFDGPVTVAVGRPGDGSCVVDIGSRAMSEADAVAAALAVDAEPAAWTAHKIDSTLRGNWAAEVLARGRRLGRAVLVVPAWPLVGRTCIGGVVHVHGQPLASALDRLPGAALRTAGDLAGWEPSAGAVAVVDVRDTEELVAVGRAVAALDVLVAGPAGAIGAVAAAKAERSGGGIARAPVASGDGLMDRHPGRPSLGGRVVVVCGSATGVAAEQLARLSAVRPDVTVLRTDEPTGDLHPGVAAALADRARVAIADAATVVIVGGDTAAAVLGDSPRLVHGYAAPGMPWSTNAGATGPVVVTKAGAFGGPDALVDLLAG